MKICLVNTVSLQENVNESRRDSRFTSTRIAAIKNMNTTKYWQECRANELADTGV